MTKKKASNIIQIRDLVSQISSVKGDLSNISAPPFILAPKSAIEIPSCWASRHSLFLAPSREDSPEKRALLVAKNYVCSLKEFVGEGSESAAKKPLNPFLGELFMGAFKGDGESTTKLFAEQVSHHPPVTACYMYNEECGMSSNGFVTQETSFSATNGVIVRQIGYAVVTDEKHEEKHLMTMPKLLVKGFTTGSLYPELEGTCYISSSSGFLTKIALNGQGKLGFGSKNQVNVSIYQVANTKTPIYSLNGQWTGSMVVKDREGNVIDKFNVDDIALTSLTVQPRDQQTPWESQRAWGEVIDGIRSGDTQMVNKYKCALERSQRERRREEQRDGIDWTGLFFRRQISSKDTELKTALRRAFPDMSKGLLDLEKTSGSWNFVGIRNAEMLVDMLSLESHP